MKGGITLPLAVLGGIEGHSYGLILWLSAGTGFQDWLSLWHPQSVGNGLAKFLVIKKLNFKDQTLKKYIPGLCLAGVGSVWD